MSKPYNEMTAAERIADRIAKNREIDRRVTERRNDVHTPPEVTRKRQAAGNALTEFQRLKQEHGIDAAAEFVRNKGKQS